MLVWLRYCKLDIFIQDYIVMKMRAKEILKNYFMHM